MAGLVMGGPGARAVADPGDVARVRANLNRFDRNLGLAMRAEGVAWGRALSAALGRAARGAPAPQAHRFSDAAEVEETDATGDTVGATVVIKAAGAGFGNDYAVLNATEYGSSLKRFHAPRGGRYWIAPTVRAAEPLAHRVAERTTTTLVARCNNGG